ncbi:glycerate kinase [Candidatus Enterococcus ikei]|nr:glycerate kinase [Enterococcus sp. DIV0869a]
MYALGIEFFDEHQQKLPANGRSLVDISSFSTERLDPEYKRLIFKL